MGVCLCFYEIFTRDRLATMYTFFNYELYINQNQLITDLLKEDTKAVNIKSLVKININQ